MKVCRERIVLLVEDNSDDLDLTLRAFRKNRIPNQVVVARDGAEVLEQLFGPEGFAERQGGIPPLVLLLDLKLPRVDGLEVLRRVRADPRTALLPVVILTSSTEDVDLVRGYELGANSYVRKPIDFSEFMDTARQLGQYWLGLNQMPAGGSAA